MSKIDDLEINKILIIDLAFIGDVILAGPLTRTVRDRWPQAEITMLTVPLTSKVAEMLPAVDKVLVYDKKNRHRGLKGMWQIARDLRNENFDLAICMNFALRGAAVARMAGIPYRLGYDAQHAGWFLTWAASHIRDGIKHETKNHLEVLKPFGLVCKDFHLELIPGKNVEEAFVKKAAALNLPAAGEYHVVCPIGSYERKNMPQELGTELIKELNKIKPVYLIGGPAESSALLEMAHKTGLSEKRVLAGSLSLPELAVFLKQSDSMVSVDTGPMHIAQAVQCPTVALFGPTDPVIWGPQNSNSEYIYTSETCSPCWGKGECSGNICMTKIKLEEIMVAVKKVKAKS